MHDAAELDHHSFDISQKWRLSERDGYDVGRDQNEFYASLELP